MRGQLGTSSQVSEAAVTLIVPLLSCAGARTPYPVEQSQSRCFLVFADFFHFPQPSTVQNFSNFDSHFGTNTTKLAGLLNTRDGFGVPLDGSDRLFVSECSPRVVAVFVCLGQFLQLVC